MTSVHGRENQYAGLLNFPQPSLSQALECKDKPYGQETVLKNVTGARDEKGRGDQSYWEGQDAKRKADNDGHRSDSDGHRSDSDGHRSDSDGHRSDSDGHRSDSDGHRSDRLFKRSGGGRGGGPSFSMQTTYDKKLTGSLKLLGPLGEGVSGIVYRGV
jgi:hypothetical protein